MAWNTEASLVPRWGKISSGEGDFIRLCSSFPGVPFHLPLFCYRILKLLPVEWMITPHLQPSRVQLGFARWQCHQEIQAEEYRDLLLFLLAKLSFSCCFSLWSHRLKDSQPLVFTVLNRTLFPLPQQTSENQQWCIVASLIDFLLSFSFYFLL